MASLNLKVAVRVRPFNRRELEMESKLIVEMDGKKTRLMKPSKLASMRELTGRDAYNDFTFDYSYCSFDDADEKYTPQDQVFQDLGTDVVECAFQGYNACVFAYGQTGSGKTYTMMGSAEMQGLIPRICKALFGRMQLGKEEGTGYKTQVSYLEIYNERVKDLLGPPSIGHGLRVREHRVLGPYVENLSQHPVADFGEIQQCMIQGNNLRTTASTNMNDTSSRSHAIFTITFVQAGYQHGMPSETVSKIHLVDLAGSERATATGATGQRLKEGAHINKSLVTLGSVISALAEQTNPTNSKRILYVPYRDSILTWLLKDSLGGNSKTIMIAAISPADCNYSETLSTLRYANRAKNIVNKPTINEDPNVKLIRDLREEIFKLKSMLTSDNSPQEASMKVLKDLQKKEAQEKVLTEEWTEKWREAQSILREQSLGLRKSGVGVVLDSEIPHLIGIHDDIHTGVTLYSLKEGETLIGTDNANYPQDIVLTGLGIQAEHCKIVLEDGNATIYPLYPSQCWLNAKLIEDPAAICQGDILLLGRTNMFRYNNPAEAALMRKDNNRSSRMDLSRLSWIAASRENLCNSFIGEEDSLTSPQNLFKQHRHYIPAEQVARDADLQEEHKKILETIENALKQLNSERVHMHEQYKNKVRIFSEELERLDRVQQNSMTIFDCKIKEMHARREMLLWEQSNERTQVDILARQLSALESQLDSKKSNFYEYVAKELQELQNCGKLDEASMNMIKNLPVSEDYSEVLMEVSKTLDNFSAQYIKDIITKNKCDISKYEDELKTKETLLSESSLKMEEMNKKLTDLEKENQRLLSAKTDDELNQLQMRKQSLSLNLNNETQSDSNGVANNKTNTLDTCDTFHTAKSDCSFASAIVSPDEVAATAATTRQKIIPTPDSVSDNNYAADDEQIMSDSGVSFDIQNHFQPPKMTNGYVASSTPKLNNKVTNSSTINRSISKRFMTTDSNMSSSSSSTETNNYMTNFSVFEMNMLRQKIATKKAEIMKCLELECDKKILDEKISKLQDYQKQFIKIEVKMQEYERSLNRNDCFSDSELNIDRDRSGSLADSDDTRINSAYSTSAIFTNRLRLARSLYEPTLTRSLTSMDTSYQTEHIINIPTFLLRGAGKQTHYEYEVRISLPDDRWILLRRYSRFRDLYLSMKNQYGDKLKAIPFPRRELFSINMESVAKNRRRMLETYLRRLLVVCSKIPDCPIYEGEGSKGLTKTTIIEFSNFFKKGLFESGKHGTG